jgi:hypothetical protein
VAVARSRRAISTDKLPPDRPFVPAILQKNLPKIINFDGAVRLACRDSKRMEIFLAAKPRGREF